MGAQSKQRYYYSNQRHKNRGISYGKSIIQQIRKASIHKWKRDKKENKSSKELIKEYIGKWFDPLVIVTTLLCWATFQLYKEAANEEIRLQKDFEIENSPTIQVFNMKFDTLGVGKKMVFEFGIANFGRQSAIILDGNFKLIKTDTLHYRNFNDLISYSDLNAVYLAPNTNSVLTWTDHNITSVNDYQSLLTGSSFYYLLGKFKYQNNGNNKKYLYTFDIQIRFFPRYAQAAELNTITEVEDYVDIPIH